MTAPFFKPVNVRTLPRSGRHVSHRATGEERERIAAYCELNAVDSFVAQGDLRPWKGEGVLVRGEIDAQVIQPCAVTADPLNATISETFELTLVPEGSKLARFDPGPDGEMVVDVDGPDLPDTFSGDSIDLAEIWLEFFILALDPFLKGEGAQLPEPEAQSADNAESSPFAQLKSLKPH